MKRTAIIAHVDHRKSSLTAAITKVLAETRPDPECEVSGKCEPYDWRGGLRMEMCRHCGAEMHYLNTIGWVRWDHPSLDAERSKP